jgi:hypothetical protein
MVAMGYDRSLPCTDTPAYVWQGGTAGDDQARAMLLSSTVPNSVAAAGSNVGVVIAGFSQGAFAGASYGGVDTVLGDVVMLQVLYCAFLALPADCFATFCTSYTLCFNVSYSFRIFANAIHATPLTE